MNEVTDTDVHSLVKTQNTQIKFGKVKIKNHEIKTFNNHSN